LKKILVQGKVKGVILKSETPINFLGTVDKKTGIISDKNHELFEKSIKNSVLVFPSGVGSSVGAYTIYSIKSNNSAPLAMICQKADLTVATGCALANIPLVIISDEEFSSFQNGQKISLDTESENLISIIQ
jgi:predicted aconitase with swiveling domain